MCACVCFDGETPSLRRAHPSAPADRVGLPPSLAMLPTRHRRRLPFAPRNALAPRSELVRWLGKKAEDLGVEIYPGFAGEINAPRIVPCGGRDAAPLWEGQGSDPAGRPAQSGAHQADRRRWDRASARRAMHPSPPRPTTGPPRARAFGRRRRPTPQPPPPAPAAAPRKGKEPLFDWRGAVAGVATGDFGVSKDGARKPAYAPGVDLVARCTLLGEGARGSLSEARRLFGGWGIQGWGVGHPGT
jgi:hypothetical protein